MSSSRISSTYLETEVLSSSPERLVPILYEHLLVRLTRGMICMRKDDIEGKFDNLARAADIVSELLSALDFDAGGELATRLAALYGFWIREISAAGREMSPTRLEGVASMVASLIEAWEQAARLVESGEATTGIGGNPA